MELEIAFDLLVLVGLLWCVWTILEMRKTSIRGSKCWDHVREAQQKNHLYLLDMLRAHENQHRLFEKQIQGSITGRMSQTSKRLKALESDADIARHERRIVAGTMKDAFLLRVSNRPVKDVQPLIDLLDEVGIDTTTSESSSAEEQVQETQEPQQMAQSPSL